MASEKKPVKEVKDEVKVDAEPTSAADLKTFLTAVRDKMTDDVAPPIYVLSALNHVMNLPKIYELLDNDNKEIARDIWLRLKQAGVQVKNPPLLFGPQEDGKAA